MEKATKLKKRSEINKKYKWDLTAMYTSDEEFEKDFEKAKQLMLEVGEFKGKLDSGSKKLLKCLELNIELERIASKLYTYSRMKKDEDNTNSVYTALHDRAQSILTEASEAAAFIVPEIIAFDNEKLSKYFEKRPELKLYDIYIENIRRKKEHVLSAREEEILAATGDMANSSSNIFRMFNNADIKFPSVRDEEGNLIQITHGNFISLLENKNRKLREKTFKGLYNVYKSNKNSLTAMMNANVKKDIFYAKMRSYKSSLESYLDEDNVSVEVYDKLIETVNNHLPLMHRYMDIKKRMLELDELHMYDIYIPFAPAIKKNLSYNEGKKIMKEGLAPLGQDYLDIVEEGLTNSWIDVYENEGKTSGAYSWGTYDSKPYILLNYQDNIDSVFTLAHEMGHSVHTYLSTKNQPYLYSEYTIFVAEVASTTNENLLMRDLLNKTTDKKEKMFYLNHYLEEFRTTLYRQVMFAEFEKWTHEMAEKGEGLTADALRKYYYDLNVKYYGPSMKVDSEIDMEWARIPHFYTPFYVYKYAIGFSAAVALSKAILEEGETAVSRYKDFLKSGCTDYPINLLKKAGVDMNTPKPVEDALSVFESLLDEMEELIKEK